MSYDTDHVQNAGAGRETIIGIHAFTELVNNTALASVYTAIRNAPTATGPELVDTADVSKKTVYEYLHKLEQAGLISEVDREGSATVYAAEDFELTLTVRDITVSITPELVEIIARKDEYPVIDRVLEDHGIVTVALAYDLVKYHSDGDVTTRQIASLTGLSSGTTYDILEAIYAIHGLGENDSSPTMYTPEDFDDKESDSLGISTDER